jgi:hypothetical protein
MANRDLASTVRLTSARNAAAITSNTTTAGIEIDRAGFDSVTFAMQSATITDGTYTPLIEETDTAGSGYTAVADADLTVTEASVAFVATDDNVVKKIGYLGGKRYVRLSYVSTGVTSGGTLSALAILGHASQQPVA